MLKNSYRMEFESPTQEDLNLLNSMPAMSSTSSEWSTLLQDQQGVEKDMNPNFLQYNPLTLGIPENCWSNMGVPSYGFAIPVSPYINDQELRKDFNVETLIDDQNKLNKDCRAYNCLQYLPCQEYCTPYNPLDTENGKQFFPDVDSRYDLPKLSDFSSDITNMINMTLPENVDNELLKVVDTDDESDIVVEESDTESEISISDVGPYLDNDQLKMSCIVCNLSYKETAASNFIELNSNYPHTYVTKTPIVVKLIEIIPIDMQNLVKFENTLICRRCYNLIDTTENLEFKLINIKQELCAFLAKTKPCCIQEDNIVPHEILQLKTVPEVEQVEICEKEPEKKLEPKESNEPKGRYLCDTCGRQYIHKYRLNAHLAKHEGLFKFSCEHCKKGFQKENNYKVHLRTHKEERKYQCKSCIATFTEESELAIHVCTSIQYLCDECPRAFVSQDKLDLHLDLSHKKHQHICKVCNKEFKHPSALNVHQRVHSEKKEHLCDHCGRSYKSKSHLNNHLRTHFGFKCKKCSLVFDIADELKEHSKKHDEEIFKCQVCNKEFADKRYLKAHEKVHNGASKTCPICSKTFKYNFKMHMLTHSTFKNLKCEKCDITFSFKTALVRHNKKKHPKDKPD